VLSNRHTACALYVTLAEAAFIPKDEVSTFQKPHSRLDNWEAAMAANSTNLATPPFGGRPPSQSPAVIPSVGFRRRNDHRAKHAA
jgi:hypothetical protein